ncbi:hypothetical protein ACJJTC_008142 [Scirpophaga incertulas]
MASPSTQNLNIREDDIDNDVLIEEVEKRPALYEKQIERASLSFSPKSHEFTENDLEPYAGKKESWAVESRQTTRQHAAFGPYFRLNGSPLCLANMRKWPSCPVRGPQARWGGGSGGVMLMGETRRQNNLNNQRWWVRSGHIRIRTPRSTNSHPTQRERGKGPKGPIPTRPPKQTMVKEQGELTTATGMVKPVREVSDSARVRTLAPSSLEPKVTRSVEPENSRATVGKAPGNNGSAPAMSVGGDGPTVLTGKPADVRVVTTIGGERAGTTGYSNADPDIPSTSKEAGDSWILVEPRHKKRPANNDVDRPPATRWQGEEAQTPTKRCLSQENAKETAHPTGRDLNIGPGSKPSPDLRETRPAGTLPIRLSSRR